MPEPNRFKLIFFDADDTLFDFQQCEHNALVKTFKKFDIDPLDSLIEKYREFNHVLWKDLEKGLLKQEDIKHERFRLLVDYCGWRIKFKQMSQEYIQNISNQRILISGAEGICRYLYEKKYTLLLLTNGISEIQRGRFEKSALHKYFSKIVISEEACCSKPDPGIFEWALQDTGFDNKMEMMIIGDSLSSDIRGGINFGISTCWFNPDDLPGGAIHPDYTINNLEKLKLIL